MHLVLETRCRGHNDLGAECHRDSGPKFIILDLHFLIFVNCKIRRSISAIPMRKSHCPGAVGVGFWEGAVARSAWSPFLTVWATPTGHFLGPESRAFWGPNQILFGPKPKCIWAQTKIYLAGNRDFFWPFLYFFLALFDKIGAPFWGPVKSEVIYGRACEGGTFFGRIPDG